MTTATCTSSQIGEAEGVRTPTSQPLARDQYFALARLQHFLERRNAVDALRLVATPEDEGWLVGALDKAIVSYYRLAESLCVQTQAELLLQAYRTRAI